MKKQTQMIIKVVCLVLVIVLVILIIKLSNYAKTDNKLNDKINNICESIERSKSNKDNFIVFLAATGEDPKKNSVINKLVNDYDSLINYSISLKDTNDSCVKEILIDSGLSNDIGNNVNLLIAYHNGSYVGGITAFDDVVFAENFLIEHDVIKKVHQPYEDNLNTVKKNIKNEYLILLYSSADSESYAKQMSSTFADYKYTIINIKDIDGVKIYSYLKKNYKFEPVLPQLLYFKNSKLIINQPLYDDGEYNSIKSKIENSN